MDTQEPRTQTLRRAQDVKNNVEFGETGTFIAKDKIEKDVELLIKYDGNSTGGKYWDVWGKEHGKDASGAGDGGTSPPSPPTHPHPPMQVLQGNDGREGPSCSRRGTAEGGAGGPMRRPRMNAIGARASASVIGELVWRTQRYERGEGGGVT